MPAALDLTGRVIARLTVTRRAERPPGRTATGTWWACACVCGTAAVVSARDLRRAEKGGRDGVYSCGCLQREKVLANAVRARAAVDPAHAARLTQPVWARVCKSCGAAFTGTARQQYCGRGCRPKPGRLA